LYIVLGKIYNSNMQFTKNQIDALSKYFADLSKILIASTVIGFFIPTGAGPITIPVFITGTFVALLTLFASIRLAK